MEHPVNPHILPRVFAVYPHLGYDEKVAFFPRGSIRNPVQTSLSKKRKFVVSHKLGEILGGLTGSNEEEWSSRACNQRLSAGRRQALAHISVISLSPFLSLAFYYCNRALVCDL